MQLSKYETQSKLSVVLGALGILLAMTAATMMAGGYDSELKTIIYNSREGLRFPAILGSLGAAVLLGTLGFFSGFNSAGQKRNTSSQLAWIGFFVSAGALALTLSVGVFFYLNRTAIEQ